MVLLSNVSASVGTVVDSNETGCNVEAGVTDFDKKCCELEVMCEHYSYSITFFVSKPVVGSVESIISVLISLVLGSSTLGSVSGSRVSLINGSKN